MVSGRGRWWLFVFGGLSALCAFSALAAGRSKSHGKKPDSRGEDRHPAREALAGLDVTAGLTAQLFASEPMMLNPTNIDVDERGRVWVCEVVNYRHNNGRRPAGDRILILEDTDGDGVADKCTVFYQGRDINAALGICVLGNKVIVACSPNVFVFTNDGHDHAAKKELLFTKTGTVQHDHSAHTFVFGPDGRLYWNCGNEGHAVYDKDGKPVVDLDGHRVVDDGKPYYDGMVFRCNPDGSRFEVLADNFRNNYEVAVDSFGSLWQSDNDDDGNRACRINYVMEYGNFGYVDELTGQSWKTPRTNMESEIPARHWHQNDPGVVPNLLMTGAGAPCGIMVYEGNLLPSVYRNQMIHTDAGVNVVRAYPVTPDGAGYQARIQTMLVGTRDKWFRPVDVCAAPDGSLIVADWYDPGVGGHHQGDEDHGRLFRITVPGHERYVMPKYDFATPEGAAEALKSPNLAARYRAWTALAALGTKAEPALVKLWHDANPRFRARALWLLGRIEGRGQHYVDEAIKDPNPDLRITGVRLARQLELPILPLVQQLVDDPSAAVRRDCAIALRNNTEEEAAKLWGSLAQKYDGRDRWYLEALGIGAANWDWCLSYAGLQSFLDKQFHNLPGMSATARHDIVWRSRGRLSSGLLAKIILDPATAAADLPRFLRAFDFQSGPEKDQALTELVAAQMPHDPSRASLIHAEAIQRLDPAKVAGDPKLAAVFEHVLDGARGTPEFVDLVGRFHVEKRYGELLKLAEKNPHDQLGVDAIEVLLNKGQSALIAAAISGDDADAALATAAVLGTAGEHRAMELLMPIMHDTNRGLALRREAARSLVKSHAGAMELIDLAKAGKLDPQLKDAVTVPLSTAPWRDVKQEAASLFPLPRTGLGQALPTIQELVKLRGDAVRGHQVFITRGTCVNCHRSGNEGKDVGPNLSEIGDKLLPPAMYESILYPSAAIAAGYEAYQLVTTGGTVTVGLLVDRTADVVRLKNAEGIVFSYKPADIDSLNRLDMSIMPADLQKNMTAEDLADLVAYLETLKKKK